MGLNLITGPALEPLTLAETKLHLRVDISDDDTLIASLISSARRQAELFMRRALINQTWELVLDTFPSCDEIRLPLPPLVSVTSIKYTIRAGTQSTFAATNYRVFIGREPGIVKLKYNCAWPGDALLEAQAVAVQYVCGYGAAAANVPVNIRQGMLMLIGHWYENREAVVVGTTAVELPMAIHQCWWPDRYFG